MHSKEAGDKLVSHWTVDYNDGDGPREIEIPHSWNQDVGLEYEGPVRYRTLLETDGKPATLAFGGISYEAIVSLDDEVVATHRGIWDGFSVPIPSHRRPISVTVDVIKNGGQSFPVSDCLSGFLPYVFNTFGGIFREAWLYHGDQNPFEAKVSHGPKRVATDGGKILYRGEPYYVRGILHWGWYPELGRPNPSRKTIEDEVAKIKALGFNCVKFCLWLPPRAYLEVLDAFDMTAWIELPLWAPKATPEFQTKALAEVERIVRRYRAHPNIIAWTCGCELGSQADADFRSRLFDMVRSLTASALVRDDSGGSEMYGGDAREFATFEDFHPYADLPFFAPLIDSNLPRTQPFSPVLLGEFNDVDAHRDLARMADERPYWTSSLPELNAIGVRWQYDLPEVLASNRFAHEPEASRHEALMASSIDQCAFVRKAIVEKTRSTQHVSGYVITTLRDTPISSAGFFDDWGEPRFTNKKTKEFNGGECLFLSPRRKPLWVAGGGREGYHDTCNFFVGQLTFEVGIHSETKLHAGGLWRLEANGAYLAGGSIAVTDVPALTPTKLGTAFVDVDIPGEYEFVVEFADTSNRWPVSVIEGSGEPEASLFVREEDLLFCDSAVELGITSQIFEGNRFTPGVICVGRRGANPGPFWREAAYQFETDFWKSVEFAEKWHKFAAISSEGSLNDEWLEKFADGRQITPVLRRIDTRTYRESLVIAAVGDGCLVTTLRPYGGLGSQPPGLRWNPAGVQFVRGAAAFLAAQSPKAVSADSRSSEPSDPSNTSSLK